MFTNSPFRPSEGDWILMCFRIKADVLWKTSYSLIVVIFLALFIHCFHMDFVASDTADSHGTGGCEMKLILICCNLLNLFMRIASLWNHLHHEPLVAFFFFFSKGLTYSMSRVWLVLTDLFIIILTHFLDLCIVPTN